MELATSQAEGLGTPGHCYMGNDPQASPVPVGKDKLAKAAGQASVQCIAGSTGKPEESDMRDADVQRGQNPKPRILQNTR